MQQVEIYTRAHCGYCRRAKALFEEMDVDFTEIDASEDDAVREEMRNRSGRQTFPQVFIGGRHVGGFDEITRLDDSGELEKLVGVAT